MNGINKSIGRFVFVYIRHPTRVAVVGSNEMRIMEATLKEQNIVRYGIVCCLRTSSPRSIKNSVLRIRGFYFLIKMPFLCSIPQKNPLSFSLTMTFLRS